MPKVKFHKRNQAEPTRLLLRMADVQREQADATAKSVPVIIATENPVERIDEATQTIYYEILSMDGVRFRGDRNQLPIVDSHNRSTVANVIGSVRNIRVEGDKLVGDAVFARDSDSQTALQKLLDGHLTDFSITALISDGIKINRGEKYMFRGKEIEGPAVIVTEWVPTDASLVATGADETSTVRELLRSYFPTKESKRMLSTEMQAALVAKGMPEQITDTEQALAWAIGLLSEMKDETETEDAGEVSVEMPVETEMAMATEEPKPEEVAKAYSETDEEKIARALQADNKRRKEILALCQKAKVERAFAERLCEPGISLETARKTILEKLMENSKVTGQGPTVVSNGVDRLQNAIRDGLTARAMQSTARRQFKTDNLADGWQDFQRMGMTRMCEELLRAQGVATNRLSATDIARIAIGDRKAIDRAMQSGIMRSAYHTTGSFANLMLDVANKTLLAGYEEAPYTWSFWARQAPSVPDFKAINRIRFSEVGNLEMVPEKKGYPEERMSDSKESYSIEKHGGVFTVSWETIINDDLDAISRVPQMQGSAARRTQNLRVYEVLTRNALMGDNQALFSASHASGSNLSGASADPSVGTLNTAFAAMMLQKGLNSDAILNIVPRYLIVPVALAATAEQLVSSTSYIVANGNEGVRNIYGPGGSRPLQVIAEPLLDANSTTAWYLSADPSQIDTVEIAFLQGEETPVLENEWDFDHDCWKYKVRQTFGVKAIDWRGLYKYAAS